MRSEIDTNLLDDQSVKRQRHDRPVLTIHGGPGGLSRDSLRELWVFREVLWAFMIRHFKVKYKQAVIGVGWALLQPLITAALFTLFLGRLAHVPSEGGPYALFVLTGLVAWTYFAAAAGSAMDSLITDQALLRKVYFPREILPLASVGAAVIDLVPGLTLLGIAALVFGAGPTFNWFTIPLLLAILVISAAAVGIGLSAINVFYRDVRHALPYLLQLGLFASPVVYSLGLVPGRWRTLYGILNPVAAVIDGLRHTLLHGTQPDWTITIGALAWATVLFLFAYYIFKRLERGVVDRI